MLARELVVGEVSDVWGGEMYPYVGKKDRRLYTQFLVLEEQARINLTIKFYAELG
jgi:hypothetical protein